MAEGGKSIKFGDHVLEISNPNGIQPVSCDLIVESRVFGSIACISFVSVSTDGDNAKPEATISARIRMSLSTAMDLRSVLDNLLRTEMPGKEMAN